MRHSGLTIVFALAFCASAVASAQQEGSAEAPTVEASEAAAATEVPSTSEAAVGTEEPAASAASEPLSPLDEALMSALGGLNWGDTEEAVLEAERERILDAYRLSIAGETDPLVIDRLRREADEEFESIRDARVVFDGPRTGFEVSVLRGEVVGGRNQTMIPVRDDVALRYYVFENGLLKRLVVTYDQAGLGYIHFEPFYERLLPLFGDPADADWVTDDIGRENLVRVQWSGDVSRLRLEDRTEMFASYVLVYDDASWSAPEAPAAATGSRQSSARSAIGDLMNRLESDEQATDLNDGVVDEILGAPTEVELRIRVEEGDIPGEGSGEGAEGEGVAEEAAEAPSTPRRTTPRPAEEEEDDDGGEIVY